MTPAQRRTARQAQARHRGSKSSHKTELENALLMLAWEAEVLSEGQVSHLLDLDRVSIRQMRLDMLDKATRFAESLYTSTAPRSLDGATPGGCE